MTDQADPKERFTVRVADYVKYRPSYPADIVRTLAQEYALTPDSVIADVGSGTGLLAELFLQNGNILYGIEPNAGMRTAGEHYLAGYDSFHSVNAAAENTTLPDGSSDFVTAGQAFHWFDRTKSKTEFLRILKPSGIVALVWNERDGSASPFMAGYEELLNTVETDYNDVSHKRLDDSIFDEFFGVGRWRKWSFDNTQTLDYDGLLGRLASSSYAPLPDDPRHVTTFDTLRKLFDTHQTDGTIVFVYSATLWCGRPQTSPHT